MNESPTFAIVYPETGTMTGEQIMMMASDAVANGDLMVMPRNPAEAAIALHDAGLITLTNTIHDRNREDREWDGFRDDVEADADVLRSAGWGTDEEYGFFGDDGYDPF
jgi:hypothetical protein